MAVVPLHQERPSKAYSCDACGSNDPHCKACAAAREMAAKGAELVEGQRQRQQAYRDRKKALRNAPVENVEDFEDFANPKEYEALNYQNVEAHFAPPPKGTEEAMKIRAFLYRASEARAAATIDWIKGVKVTKEMRDAADAAIEAWKKLRSHLD